MWPFWSSAWKDVVARKRAQRDEAIKAGVEILAAQPALDTLLKDEILCATAVEIVRNIEARKKGWTAESVMLVYISQAIDAHYATNCLTEVMFVQALEEAKVLDKEFAASGRLKGPLHGVPLSIKDMFNIKGVDSTIGFSDWAFHAKTDDALVVKYVRTAGAIPFTKTNASQTLLAFECANPVFGRTTNPWNSAFGPGGSSGGEAALLACGGSGVGIGSDIGGSVRIPAHYSGIFSLKFGRPRFPYYGHVSSNLGFEAVMDSAGPMARSVADITLLCQTICGQPGGPGDALAPVPWRDVKLPAQLCVGYYISDGLVEQSPACKRAVLEAVDALRRAGHQCIEFVPPHAVEALEIFTALTSADGYDELLSGVGSDPHDPSIFLPTLGPKIPSLLRPFLKWVISTVIGDRVFAVLFDASKRKSVRTFHHWVERRNALMAAWDAEVWQAHAFDVLLCPPQAVPALPHGATHTLSPLAGATILYNVLHLPAGILPITRVRSSDIWVAPAKGSEGEGSKLITSGTRKAYDAAKMEGLPVGVQVVGREWEDERVVEVMRLLDGLLGARGFGPGTWPAGGVGYNGREG